MKQVLICPSQQLYAGKMGFDNLRLGDFFLADISKDRQGMVTAAFFFMLTAIALPSEKLTVNFYQQKRRQAEKN